MFRTRVIRALENIIEWRGKPSEIRADNGPELAGHALRDWAEGQNIKLSHIQPGKHQQNAYIERYNRAFRHDWLGQYLFLNLTEVQEHATRWLWSYNHQRPNMALGGIIPIMRLAQAA